MKKIAFTLMFVLMMIFTYAQPKIEFEKTTYDFGTIKEEDGKKTGRFEFTNVGDSTLELKSVRASCGCTATNYTKTPVAPGEKGFIDATYDPRNRPGSFSKTVRITTNEPKFRDPKAAPHILTIKGNVQKRPPTAFELAGYKIGNGMVRLKENSKKFEIKNTESHIDTFAIRNFWDRSVTVEYLNMPPHISEVYRSFGQQIPPGKEEIIVIKYDGSKRGDFGNLNDRLMLKTTDSIEANKVILYNVKIKEDFSHLTPKQLKNAPHLVMDTTGINFGEVMVNNSVIREFPIKNTGKEPLVIRSIQPSTNAVRPEVTKMTIEPGSTYNLKMTYKAPNRLGKQSGTIDFISNDPSQDVLVLKFTAQTSK